MALVHRSAKDVKPKIEPYEQWPDDQLIEAGKIRELFNRVKARTSKIWDPETRTRSRLHQRRIALFHCMPYEECLKIIESDCLGEYIDDLVHAYIVRTDHSKYAVEIFDRLTEMSASAYFEVDFEECFHQLTSEMDAVAAPASAPNAVEILNQPKETTIKKFPATKRSRGRPKKTNILSLPTEEGSV